MDLSEINKALDAIDKKMDEQANAAKMQHEASGKVAKETADALQKLGEMQLEYAQRLLKIEQAKAPGADKPGWKSYGEQFVEAAAYKAFADGQTTKVRLELKAPLLSTDLPGFVVGKPAVLPSTRMPGIRSAPEERLTLEDLLNSMPVSTQSVDYIRETAFVNNAAEVAEGAAKPESTVSFDVETAVVRTVAHWTRISKQLAADAPALVAWINRRMEYGVNLRVDRQLLLGDGTGQNIKGLYTAGNFLPHGFTAAALGAGATRIDLVGRVLAAIEGANYSPNGIILNPADWWIIQLLKDSQGRYLLGDPASRAARVLWNTPVATTNAMTADNFLVGDFAQAGTVLNREGLTVDLSEHDADNFTKNLITIRAERRVGLMVEKPIASVGGDLTPA